MALREFTDKNGVAWRVWDITPDTAHPATRLEDYLQGFLDGWLVFEAVQGKEKRRLYPLPARWHDAEEHELESLLHGASPVSAGEGRNDGDDGADDAPHRTFTYPGGGVWTVAETPALFRDERGRPMEALTVLRFRSGQRQLDLFAWPRDWSRRSDEELAELLWRAFPRLQGSRSPAESQPGGSAPARRRGERGQR